MWILYMVQSGVSANFSHFTEIAFFSYYTCASIKCKIFNLESLSAQKSSNQITRCNRRESNLKPRFLTSFSKRKFSCNVW